MSTPPMSRAVSPRLPLAFALLALAAALPGRAQSQAQPQPPDQQTQQGQQPAQQPTLAAPAAGGPKADSGAIAIPQKATPEPLPPAPPKPTFKNPAGAPNVTLQINVPEVTVDVGVLLEKNHQFYAGLKPENFRVYEDGVEQKIEGFKRVQAPITALLLCEYAARGWVFRMDMLNAAWAFTQQLSPQDYVAMMTFDLNTHIVTDFTQDKSQIQQGVNQLAGGMYSPVAFSETNMFDALSESLDRLSRIEGQKYVILIASGIDTMSKLNLDQILKKVKASQDITIFTISTGGMLLAMTEGQPGMMSAMSDLTYIQAGNEMRTFSSLTGGMSFFPRFVGEFPDDVRVINQNIRSKYELIYRPTNAKQDGTWRKLRVVLVDDEGNPLRMEDQKHKQLKYDIIARDGYRASQQVE